MAPSWALRPADSQGSWGSRKTVRPKVAAYCIASRITSVLVTGWLALPTPTHPAFCSPPISARRCPSNPWVSAPTTSTRAIPARAARWWINSTTARVSTTGSVSGGQQSVVIPPAAAARVSWAIVVLVSSPGSRSRARRSTRPGHTTRPAASTARSAVKPSGSSPSPTTRPLATWRSATRSVPLAGSTTRPPRTVRRISVPPPRTTPRGSRG